MPDNDYVTDRDAHDARQALEMWSPDDCPPCLAGDHAGCLAPEGDCTNICHPKEEKVMTYAKAPFNGTPYPVGTEASLNAVPVRVLVIGADKDRRPNGHYIVTTGDGTRHSAHHSELAVATVEAPA